MHARKKIASRLSQFAFVVCVAEWVIHGAAWGLLKGEVIDTSSFAFNRIVQIADMAYLAGFLGLLLSLLATGLDRNLRLARRVALANFATFFLLGFMHTV